VPDRNPVPEQYVEAAEIPGIPSARTWGDKVPPDYEERVSRALRQLESQPQGPEAESYDVLALSGGGANGAFGAGLLVGWTAAGDRPEFDVVTGISTGALIAPFAFLGPQHDAELEEFYTTTSTEDVITTKSLFGVLGSEAATSSEPLRQTLIDVVDEEMVAAIAAQHIRGRRLWIGTTNLDAGRPVIWDIGSIAGSGHPRSASLIADILLASASIPGVFPPVFVDVQAGDEVYDEIHVDGGASSQVFFYPVSVDASRLAQDLGVQGTARIYLVRNAYLHPRWKSVEPTLAQIAGRALGSLIRNQGIGDVYRIYSAAQRDGIDFNLAYIPDSFDVESEEEFDPVYMRALFDLGFRMARDGYPWAKAPVGHVAP
jgi:predicted acylesterase/phospholipase RssA